MVVTSKHRGRDRRLSDLGGDLRAAKNGLLARFIRCAKERRRWRRHPISREAPSSERRMIACPSGGFRVQPRKYFSSWTADGRTNRERGKTERREDIHWIHSFIAGRAQRARVCQEQAREMDRWTMQKTERERKGEEQIGRLS